MSKFKVGDRVIIREDSQYYGDGKYNPVNLIGEVFNIWDTSPLSISVRWKNNILNHYSPTDLEFAIVDNKINRVLYPDYKPKDGYLIKE
jgi:hypothetical protein